MIKKSKKVMASLLMALSLIAVFPVSNAFAISVTQEENTNYINFIKDECTQTSWNKNIYYNKDTGKYYLVTNSDQYGLTMAKNAGAGGGYYGKNDGSLAQNEWIHEQTATGNYTWRYYSSDYKFVTGYQTINGKHYYFDDKGIWQTGWEKRSKDDDVKANWKDKHWYYYGEDGNIKEGWVNSGGKWYYIYSDGLMAYDTTTPDGYHVDKNGVWV